MKGSTGQDVMGCMSIINGMAMTAAMATMAMDLIEIVRAMIAGIGYGAVVVSFVLCLIAIGVMLGGSE